jgi:hypothetical protein
MPSDGRTKYLRQNYKLFSPIIAHYGPFIERKLVILQPER